MASTPSLRLRRRRADPPADPASPPADPANPPADPGTAPDPAATDLSTVEPSAAEPSTVEQSTVEPSAGQPAAPQVIYVNLTGARGITYRGPVTVHLDVPALVVPRHLRGQEAAVRAALKADLDRLLSGQGVVVTLADPGPTAHSTIYVGGDGSAFPAACGSMYGISEKVDAGNRSPDDLALVFSENIPSVARTAEGYAKDLAKYVRADIMADGKLAIGGKQYDVHPAIRTALEQYPAFYYAGAVGPDGFPDLVFGQSLIHPVDTGTWIARAFAMAWAAPPDPAYTSQERQQILAWTYGFATHAAGDFWGHTFVNELSDGVFPAISEVAQDNQDLANAVRHLMVEAYAGDATPGFDNNPQRSLLPDGDISDDATPGSAFDAPVDFIYQVLIKPFPGDPTAAASTLLTSLVANAGSNTFTRVTGSFLADGFKAGQLIRAYGFTLGKGPFHVVSVSATTLTVAETLVSEAATGDEWLSTQGSRGAVIDSFFELKNKVDALVLIADAGKPPLTQTFDQLVAQVIAALQDNDPTTPSASLVDQLFRAYLHNWTAEITSGLRNWARLGLATSKALFDADARRHLQNAVGANRGVDSDPTRADAENGVGLLDTFLDQL